MIVFFVVGHFFFFWEMKCGSYNVISRRVYPMEVLFIRVSVKKCCYYQIENSSRRVFPFYHNTVTSLVWFSAKKTHFDFPPFPLINRIACLLPIVSRNSSPSTRYLTLCGLNRTKKKPYCYYYNFYHSNLFSNVT